MKKLSIFIITLIVGFSTMGWAKDSAIFINGKQIHIPYDKKVSLGFSNKDMIFYIDAETLHVAKPPFQKEKTIRVQLLKQSIATAENSRKSYKEIAQRLKDLGVCVEHRIDDESYNLCVDKKASDSKMDYFILTRTNDAVVSRVYCHVMTRQNLGVPQCSVRTIIFKDILLHYSFNAQYTDKIVEIDNAIHAFINEMEDTRNK